MTRAIIALILFAGPALAQHDHAQHHAFYKGWHNKLNTNCCNDQDCGALRDDDERVESRGLFVRVEGTWCPVLPHHYLQRGNVPDASMSHVCVQKQVIPAARSVCDRLLCYQPKPGT